MPRTRPQNNSRGRAPARVILINPLAREIPGSGSCQRLERLTGEVGAWAHPIPDAAEETPLAQACEATEPAKQKRGRTNKIQPQMPTALPNHGRAAQ